MTTATFTKETLSVVSNTFKAARTLHTSTKKDWKKAVQEIADYAKENKVNQSEALTKALTASGVTEYTKAEFDTFYGLYRRMKTYHFGKKSEKSSEAKKDYKSLLSEVHEVCSKLGSASKLKDYQTAINLIVELSRV